MEEVEDPGVIGITAVHMNDGPILLLAGPAGWQRKLRIAARLIKTPPADVVFDLAVTPVLHVERWIGEDEVGLEVFVFVVEKAISPLDVGVDTANC